MNIRIVAAVATLLVVATSGGCSGMRNFLFGRGAACGIGPAAGPAYALPGLERGCGQELGCGYEPSCGYEPGCGYEPAARHRPFAALRGGCGLLGGRASCGGTPSCNCGTGQGRAYMPAPYDPYSSMIHDPYSQGDIVGSEIIGEYPGAVYQGGIIRGDDFDVRSNGGTSPQPLPSTPIPQ